MKHKKIIAMLAACLLVPAAFYGCGEDAAAIIDEINSAAGMEAPEESRPAQEEQKTYYIPVPEIPLQDIPVTFNVLLPEASGAAVEENDKAVIDHSNTKDGYVMVRYADPASRIKLKVMIDGPGEERYLYTLRPDGYETFPLSTGNGPYTVGVYEQVEGSRYALAAEVKAAVSLKSEFEPFIRPNQYVNYDAESGAVRKASQLIQGADGVVEKVSAVYNYVINEIGYDTGLAARIRGGELTEYLPDVDAVLASKKGICFDYAALMAAMLRCQGIPVKLVAGYAGEQYHAWLSVYSSETGWVNDIIRFDGASWVLVDPTFAASGGQSAEVLQYIGDGSNYAPKLQY